MLTDLLNEERSENTLFTGQREREKYFYACESVHTLFTGQRKRKGGREREIERERGREM